MLYYEADTAAYYGQLNKARDFSRQAIAAAERARRQAMRRIARGAVWERRGSKTECWRGAEILECTRRAVYFYVDAGDGRGQGKSRGICGCAKEPLPQDTVVQFDYVPTIYAAESRYLMGTRRARLSFCGRLRPTNWVWRPAGHYYNYMYPVYMRGQSYLAAHNYSGGCRVSENFELAGCGFERAMARWH